MNCKTVLPILTCLLLFHNGLQAGDSPKERTYGEKLTSTHTTSLGEILEHPASFSKKEVVFEATVSEVCQNKGCWMVVGDGQNKVRVDFKNYGFFVPWDSEGKKVRIQGKVYKKLIDKNVARHWAEDQKSSDVKPEEITEDREMVLVTASGVVMTDGSELSEEQKDAISGKVSKEH
jgi:hypothetical protein